jgi:hypothetical protein
MGIHHSRARVQTPRCTANRRRAQSRELKKGSQKERGPREQPTGWPITPLAIAPSKMFKAQSSSSLRTGFRYVSQLAHRHQRHSGAPLHQRPFCSVLTKTKPSSSARTTQKSRRCHAGGSFARLGRYREQCLCLCQFRPPSVSQLGSLSEPSRIDGLARDRSHASRTSMPFLSTANRRKCRSNLRKRPPTEATTS